MRQNEKLSAPASSPPGRPRNPQSLTVMRCFITRPGQRARDAAIMGEKMDAMNKIVEQVLDFARSTESSSRPWTRINSSATSVCSPATN